MADKVLHDTDGSGQDRPWREKKSGSINYSAYKADIVYLTVDEHMQVDELRKIARIEGCGQTLSFVKTDKGMKLYQTWFCKKRLCPLCAWRRSKKQAMELHQILDLAVEQEPNAEFLFLTLTEENATAQDLKTELQNMNRSLYRLRQYKDVSRDLIGTVRATEITVNDQNGTYHQHVHMLLMVKSSYFKAGHYLSQQRWSKLWRRARRLDYDPVVNVKKVRPNARKGTNSLTAAAQEVAKYQVKSSAYMTDDDVRNREVIMVLENALDHSRALGFSGLLKQIRHDLKLDTAESEDDLIGGDGAPKEGSGLKSVVYTWDKDVSNYLFGGSWTN
ncbi:MULTISPECIES: protein rep [Lactiplantibacillus]|nr:MULTISPECIES: protein rep [Lactiplantibacillus]MBU7505001.1 protein rep [Lactiplantibacillus pentosus]MCT4443944.1 protein rep [Lactiplantibacillus argentoratensis]